MRSSLKVSTDANPHGAQEATVAHLMQGQSADHAKSAQIDKYLDHSLNQNVSKAQTKDPSPKFAAILRRLDKEKKRARARKPRDLLSNMRRTHFEEMSAKESYSKFKAKHVKRFISELYLVNRAGNVKIKVTRLAPLVACFGCSPNTMRC